MFEGAEQLHNKQGVERQVTNFKSTQVRNAIAPLVDGKVLEDALVNLLAEAFVFLEHVPLLGLSLVLFSELNVLFKGLGQLCLGLSLVFQCLVLDVLDELMSQEVVTHHSYYLDDLDVRMESSAVQQLNHF